MCLYDFRIQTDLPTVFTVDPRLKFINLKRLVTLYKWASTVRAGRDRPRVLENVCDSQGQISRYTQPRLLQPHFPRPFPLRMFLMRLVVVVRTQSFNPNCTYYQRYSYLIILWSSGRLHDCLWQRFQYERSLRSCMFTTKVFFWRKMFHNYFMSEILETTPRSYLWLTFKYTTTNLVPKSEVNQKYQADHKLLVLLMFVSFLILWKF